jgi:hypothetical protein
MAGFTNPSARLVKPASMPLPALTTILHHLRPSVIGAGVIGAGLLLANPAAAEPLLDDAKLLLTNGVTSVEGSSGGGLATWSTIAGRGSERALGISAHVTAIALPDYGWQSHGLAIGIHDRVELAYARQNFDTRAVGAALGLGRGFRFNQDIFSAKLRLAGDLVYGPALLPAIAVGVAHKRSLDGPIVRAVGAEMTRRVSARSKR